MAKAINLIFAAALVAAALISAASLARVAKAGEIASEALGPRVCAERLCGVVFF